MTSHKLTVKNALTRGARVITWAGVFLAVAVQAREAEKPLMEKARQWFKPLP